MTRHERKSLALQLDELVPLSGASHSEVVDYNVRIPMRFAEVEARLVSGKTTRLANAQQFLGWSGYGPNPTLLFECGDRNIILDTGTDSLSAPTRFIAPDGDLFLSGGAA